MARPRVYPEGTAPAAAARTRAVRQRIRAEGGRVVSLALDAAEAAALDALADRLGITRADAIRQAIRTAAGV